jgi:hypothetical protein
LPKEAIMPFDDTGRETQDAIWEIDRVLAMLASASRWCKRVEHSPDGKRCLMGALNDIGAFPLLGPAVLAAIREVTRFPYRRIEDFNDDLLTSHALVMRVLRRARETLTPPASG